MEISLYFTQCFILLDLADSGGRDCYTSPENNTNETETTCLECSSTGKFLFGGSITDYGSAGHVAYLLLAIPTILVGLAATVTSAFIIKVLSQKLVRSSFEILLTVLATVDMFCGLAQAVVAICTLIYFRNWSRNWAATMAYSLSMMFAIFWKTASGFVTVAIALERYLVIAFPLQTRLWLTPLSSKIFAGVSLLLSFALTFVPILLCQRIELNKFKSVKSVAELDYLIYTTGFATIWYVDLKGYLCLDFWVPLALLILLNGLIYFHIRKFSMQRKELMMSKSLKRDLGAGKMFVSVVSILLICNIIPIIFAYFLVYWRTVHLELEIGIFLCAAINSAANLPIYYWKSPGFKEEARRVVLGFSKASASATSTKPVVVWYDDVGSKADADDSMSLETVLQSEQQRSHVSGV